MRIISIILAFTLGLPVHAASSPWFETEGARMRLLARPVTGGLEAALQVELQPGFKTYWQVPGASGVPPMITLATDPFSSSIPGASTTIRWPSPKVYRDGSGFVTGYTERVTFPIDIDGADIEPSQLIARGLIGVCGEICIPVQFSLTVPMGSVAGSSVAESRVFSAAAERVTPPATTELRIDGSTLHMSVPPSGDAAYWVSAREGTTPIQGRRDGATMLFEAHAEPGEAGLIVTDEGATRAVVVTAD